MLIWMEDPTIEMRNCKLNDFSSTLVLVHGIRTCCSLVRTMLKRHVKVGMSQAIVLLKMMAVVM